MLRRLARFTLSAAALAIVSIATPSTASAQAGFQSCSSPGVCAFMRVYLSGTNLTIRLANMDATTGSALYHAGITFSNSLGTLGAISVAPTVTAVGAVNQLGTTYPIASAGWSFDGVGGSNVLDLSSFWGVYIEGTAASAYRGQDGTFVTTPSPWDNYVEFTADLSGVAGVAGSSITDLEFDTDYGSANGAPTTLTPEPASLVLLATGLSGIGLVARRRRSVL